MNTTKGFLVRVSLMRLIILMASTLNAAPAVSRVDGRARVITMYIYNRLNLDPNYTHIYKRTTESIILLTVGSFYGGFGINGSIAACAIEAPTNGYYYGGNLNVKWLALIMIVK